MSRTDIHTLPRHVDLMLTELGVPQQATLVAAVSGGSDSIALLTALAGNAHLRSRLVVGHVDHGLRPESSRERDFVRELCLSWQLPFHSTRLALHPDDTGNLADRLRVARYEYLQSLVPEDGFLLTAHHADDQAVTLLMRLLEGAGLPGLAGIPIRRGNILRPLLNIPRAALRTFLQEQGVRWCEDASNENEASFRNRVRRHIWSRFVVERSDAPVQVAAVAQRLREDNEALQSWALQMLQSARSGYHWVEVALSVEEVPPAVLRRMLQTVLRRKWQTRPLSSTQWGEIKSRLATGRRLNLPGRITVHNNKDMLVFEHETPPSAYRFEAAGPGRYTVPAGTVILRGATFPMTVRSWKPGDRNHAGERVPDWLARHGVPHYRRAGWPVITPTQQDDEIVAIAAPKASSAPDPSDYVFEDVLFEGFEG